MSTRWQAALDPAAHLSLAQLYLFSLNHFSAQKFVHFFFFTRSLLYIVNFQAHLILSDTVLFFCFINLRFPAILYQGKLMRTSFSTLFVNFMFLCHILIILTVFQAYHHYYIYYGDLWSVIFDVTIAERLAFIEVIHDG